MAGKLKKVVTDPLSDNNPITIQILGICSALAVTTKVDTAIVMSISLTAVLTFAALIVSLLRNAIPSRIRIIVQLAVVSSLVILADQVLKAYVFDISRQLSVFVGLIITNCIVLGRLEAFSLGNKPLPSVLDGLGNGLGYSAVLIAVASMREILGFGTWYGIQLMPDGYQGNGLMLLAPGAFFCLGLLIWAQRQIIKKFETA
jgi:Na+-transporting NADH:ubiquinone oxidoreductase subunit D